MTPGDFLTPNFSSGIDLSQIRYIRVSSSRAAAEACPGQPEQDAETHESSEGLAFELVSHESPER
jgi:hypothetical protein